MTAIEGLSTRAGWTVHPLGYIAVRSQECGQPDGTPLSVFLGAGVVRRDSREDNHNVLGADLSKYLVVQSGDLVFNKLRTWQGGFGASAHVGIVSPAYFVLRPTAKADSRFLHYLLLSEPYLGELKRRSKWMPPSQFDIPWEALKLLPVTLPSIDHQRRIADFLDDQVGRMDALLALRNAQREKLNNCLLNAARAAVTGSSLSQHQPTELPWAASLPRHWAVAKLSLIARMGTGHTPSRSEPDYWIDCSIPWLTTGDVYRFRCDEIDTLEETAAQISKLGLENSAAVLHPAGTVALSRTASAGFSIVMGQDMATSQDFVTWTCGPRLSPHFLLWVLRASRQDLLGRLAMGSTHKTIYFPDLEMIRIPLPPMEEQVAAVEEIRSRAALIHQALKACDRSAALIAERKRALITTCVTGEFDVAAASNRAGDAALQGVAR